MSAPCALSGAVHHRRDPARRSEADRRLDAAAREANVASSRDTRCGRARATVFITTTGGVRRALRHRREVPPGDASCCRAHRDHGMTSCRRRVARLVPTALDTAAAGCRQCSSGAAAMSADPARRIHRARSDRGGLASDERVAKGVGHTIDEAIPVGAVIALILVDPCYSPTRASCGIRLARMPGSPRDEAASAGPTAHYARHEDQITSCRWQRVRAGVSTVTRQLRASLEATPAAAAASPDAHPSPLQLQQPDPATLCRLRARGHSTSVEFDIANRSPRTVAISVRT